MNTKNISQESKIVKITKILLTFLIIVVIDFAIFHALLSLREDSLEPLKDKCNSEGYSYYYRIPLGRNVDNVSNNIVCRNVSTNKLVLIES